MADAQYDVLEKIGHGSFGVIRKVRRKMDGMVMCRKEISYLKMSQKERGQLQSEFQILSTLRHPNIVGYYHRDHLKNSQDVHLYMEYCGNGDLGKVIKDLVRKGVYADEGFIWSTMAQLISALYLCHYGVDPPSPGNGVGLGIGVKPPSTRSNSNVTILHRDLKPENVFLGENNSVKLGDFGLSKIIQSHDFASTYVGTPFYMSPEICAAERYTLKSDIWSLGCIMYELAARAPPFNARTHMELVQRIKLGKIAPLPRHYTGELMTVIRECLRTNPDSRPDTATLLNMPIVRLMRKELEIVDMNRAIKLKEAGINLKVKEIQYQMASMEAEKARMRQEIDGSLRREWEVKARLEIDRLVNLEIASLQKRFEGEVLARARDEVKVHMQQLEGRVQGEVQARVQQELQNRAAAYAPPTHHGDMDSSMSSDFQCSVNTNADGEFPSTTDITELSPEPMVISKTVRTPFNRAQTMIVSSRLGTPMDIEMLSPSPIVLSHLALSPRRRAATKAQNGHAPTIFQASDANRYRDVDPVLSESDEEMPSLPSPSRKPRLQQGFGARPALTSMQTAPINQTRRHASMTQNKLAIEKKMAGACPGGNMTIAEANGLGKVLPLTGQAGQGKESRKNPFFPLVPTQNAGKLAANNNVKGRTLVELTQARAGDVGVKWNRAATWDPYKEEQPSPFSRRWKSSY